MDYRMDTPEYCPVSGAGRRTALWSNCNKLCAWYDHDKDICAALSIADALVNHPLEFFNTLSDYEHARESLEAAENDGGPRE